MNFLNLRKEYMNQSVERTAWLSQMGVYKYHQDKKLRDTKIQVPARGRTVPGRGRGGAGPRNGTRTNASRSLCERTPLSTESTVREEMGVEERAAQGCRSCGEWYSDYWSKTKLKGEYLLFFDIQA